MNDYDFRKLRFKYLQQCYKHSKLIRIQDWERTKKNSGISDLRHYLLSNILTNNKSYFTLINHSELLRYSIESDEVTELRFDLDFKGKSKDHSIKNNIRVGRKLYHKLKEKGLEGVFYYSGGKGIHFHKLISTRGLNFQTSLAGVDLNKLETQFIKSNKSGSEYAQLISSNEERTSFKKQLIKWLGLDNEVLKVIDFQMTSSLTLLTLEGAKKRNAGSKYKTKIDYSKHNNLEIFDLLQTNYEPYIDFNLFNDIKVLSEAEIEEILSHSIVSIQKVPSNQNKASNQTKDLSQETLSQDTKELETIAKAVTITLFNLARQKKIQGTNNYLLKASKIYFEKVKNWGLTKKYMVKLHKMLSKTPRNDKWFEDKIKYSKLAFQDEKYLERFQLAYKDKFTELDFVEEYHKNLEVVKKYGC